MSVTICEFVGNDISQILAHVDVGQTWAPKSDAIYYPKFSKSSAQRVFKKLIPGCRSHRLLHLLGLLGMDGLQQHTLVLVDVTWAVQLSE